MQFFEINELEAEVEGIKVLRKVSIEVNREQIVSILGSNGAGKTTTLRCIAGILDIMSGNIKMEGKKIHNLPYYKRVEKGIVLVPNREDVFSDMTVKENLYLGSYISKSRKHYEESKRWVFDLFPVLEERTDQKASTLSGGEQQMLVIARGLMSSPKLLLFDEPSMGLAPKIVDDIFDTLERICKEENIASLLVEQDVSHAFSVSDYVYLMENGEIKIEGRTEDLTEEVEIKKSFLGEGY